MTAFHLLEEVKEKSSDSFMLYKAYKLSHLEYCSLRLLQLYKTLKNKLESANFLWSEYTLLVKASIYRLVLNQLQKP